MDETILKGRLTANGKISPVGSIPPGLNGEIYIAIIPDHAKRFSFGRGKMRCFEDHSIIERYKVQKKKEKSRKELGMLLNRGFNIRGKAYSSRKEIYETRTRSL